MKKPGQEEEGFKTGQTGAHCHISQDGTQAEDKGERPGPPMNPGSEVIVTLP